MSFWRKSEKNLIPPVQSEEAKRNELFGSRGNSTSPRPPTNYPRSTSSTYVPSRDGDPYSSAPRGTPPPPQAQGTNSYGGERELHGRCKQVKKTLQRGVVELARCPTLQCSLFILSPSSIC